jgi:hypothetical protein
MGCTTSCPAGEKFQLYGIPAIIFAISGGGFLALWCFGKWDSFVISVKSKCECFFKGLFAELLKSLIYGTIAVLSLTQFVRAWKYIFQGAPLSDKPPEGDMFGLGKRCIPLFSAAQQFMTDNVNTTVVYQYDSSVSNFHTTVRICTDAPMNVVFSFFVESRNFTMLNQIPIGNTGSDCPWETIARNCKTQDPMQGIAQMSCKQLLEVPPLPNGFVYRASWPARIYPPNCEVDFTLHDVPVCNYRYVHMVENNASLLTITVGVVSLSFSTLFLLLAVCCLTRLCCNKILSIVDDRPIDYSLYPFIMKTIFGRTMMLPMYILVGWPEKYLHPALFFYIFLEQMVQITIYMVSIYPCCVCGSTTFVFSYVDLYYLIGAKIILLCWDIKEFFCDNSYFQKDRIERQEGLDDMQIRIESLMGRKKQDGEVKELHSANNFNRT